MKRMLAPCFRADKITDISITFLREKAVKAAILDLDGSLVGYQHGEATPEVAAWIASLLAEGIRLCIVSNPGPKSTLAQIAAQLELKAFRGTVPKPLPRAFFEARQYLDAEFSEIAMIGDQLFTDIVGGNTLGMLTIWIDRLDGSKEGWVTRTINRRLEKLYRDKVLRKNPALSPNISKS